MQNVPTKRPKTPRVARIELPPGVFEAAFDRLQQRDVLLRLGLCLVVAIIIWAVTGAGKRPFPHRLGDTPSRTIVVRYPFSKEDKAKTDQQREVARSQARCVYVNNEDVLTNLREELKNKIVALTQPAVDQKTLTLWGEFYTPPPSDKPPAAAPAAGAASDTPAGKGQNEQPSTRTVAAPNQAAAVIPPALPLTLISTTTAADEDAVAAGEQGAKEDAADVEANAEHDAQALDAARSPAVDDSPVVDDGAKTGPSKNDEARRGDEKAATAEKPQPAADGDAGPAPPDDAKATDAPPASATDTAQAAEPKPSDAQPADAKPIDTTPTDAKPTDAKPADTPNTESKPTEPKQPAPKETEPAKPSPPPPPPPKTPAELALDEFRKALSTQEKLDEFKTIVDGLFAPLIKHGLIDALPPHHDGNQLQIRVLDSRNDTSVFRVNEVLIGDVMPTIKQELSAKVAPKFVADICFEWLRKKLQGTNTLTLNDELTRQSKEEAAAAVPTVMISFLPGMPLATAGEPIDLDHLSLLRLEYDSPEAQPTWLERLTRTAAMAGMFVALCTLCGFYITFREPRLISNLSKFSLLLGMVLATVLLSYGLGLAHERELRTEIIPLMLFGMTIAVAYQQELALLLSAAVALVVVVLLGFGMTSFVVLTATVSVAILLLGRIRSRRKLIYVGLTAGIASTLTSLGVNTLAGTTPNESMLVASLWCGLWGLVAAFLMTGLLPFIENLFGVQTDLSLIELGDVAHPLLQELVRRAPGTYNHSIMVASIAEAAADAIGAHGLLVRVGAYFHDIGKMLKPGYFVENQGQNGNRHDDLVPAMSTLIIIAHVKDGADLARQHHLPQQIIDFIQQHHGTTLVEYFYGRAAAEQRASDPDRPVDESNFRYPGPKPQTKEAAVLMLADAVESASRSLVEPAPSRIESLVHDIAMKRLLDGQFSACGLTLQELHTIQESLIKSLIAVYHGRVKYPGQRTA